jgi:hypothetical protein
VTPSLASSVVKNFILPLFAQESQHHQSKSRSSLYNNRSPSHNPKPPSLLSQQLLDLLESTENYLELLQSKLAKTQSITETTRTSLHEMRQKLNESQTIQTSLESGLKVIQDEVKNEKLRNTFRHKEKLELMGKLKEEFKERDRVIAMYEERAKLNLSLNDITMQHSHNQLMVTMDSAIVGERLKGLYDASLNVSYPAGLEDRLQLILNETNKQATRATLQTDLRLKHAEIELPNIVHLMKGSTSTFHKRNELLSDLKKMKLVITNKIQNLDQSISSSFNEASQLLRSQSFVETKVLNFTEDFSRVKAKMEELTGQNKRNDPNAERVCECCGKVFLEKDNFNWSCRTHSGAWSGSMYWCCGKTTKESLGCRLQKHFYRDEAQIENGKTEDSKKVFCMTCKCFGHPAKECHLDPNIRKNIDSRSASSVKISLDKIIDVYRKKRKKFKVKKLGESIEDLKQSLEKKNMFTPKKLKKFRTGVFSAEPSTPSISSNSPLFEHFPLISRVRGSLKVSVKHDIS